MGKIVDFNEVLKNQPEDEPNICPHCSVKFDLIDTFTELLQNIIAESPQEDVKENIFMLVNGFYDEIYSEGKRATYEQLIDFSIYNIDQIDGVTEED